jgi:integrase
VALLRKERERAARLVAGIPDGVDVDLSLIRLAEGSLIFPALPGTDPTALRNPRSVSAMFDQLALKFGFPDKLRFHDLRVSHETALLDRGVPVHTVAKRCGHTPTMLLQRYAKRTRKSDTTAANVIGTLRKGAL